MLVLKQWGALAMLAFGVGLVQVSSSRSGKDDAYSGEKYSSGDGQDPLLGLGALIVACCMSGFAGVYFEKVPRSCFGMLWLSTVGLRNHNHLICHFNKSRRSSWSTDHTL